MPFGRPNFKDILNGIDYIKRKLSCKRRIVTSFVVNLYQDKVIIKKNNIYLF